MEILRCGVRILRLVAHNRAASILAVRYKKRLDLKIAMVKIHRSYTFK